jgi:hypothetical protein
LTYPSCFSLPTRLAAPPGEPLFCEIAAALCTTGGADRVATHSAIVGANATANLVMGRNYDAVVLAAGHCGFGLGATPTAIVNMPRHLGYVSFH